MPVSTPAPARPKVLSLPLGTLVLVLVAASVAVAAAIGWALAAWLGPVAPWMVAAASAFGVALTALPLGAVLVSLARRAEPEPPAEADTVPVVLAEGAGLHGLALTREQFSDLIGREWARSRRYGTGAALLIVEMDRYGRLVEVLGDPAGDKVMNVLLQHIAPTLRGADALARHDAGQIAIFLAHADATGALDVAERVRERAERLEVPVPPKRVRFTVSVGVAHLRPAHLHLQALLDDVTDAVAAARTAGGNCVRAAPIEAGSRPAAGPARDGHRAPKG